MNDCEQELFEAGRNWVKREIYALRDDTEKRYYNVAEGDKEGKQGAYARGRLAEAKGICRAIGDVCAVPLNNEEIRAALKENPND